VEQLTAPFLGDPLYARLKEWIIERTGLAYYANKDQDLASRIERRMLVLGVEGTAAYLNFLQAGEEELDALIVELTIGETYFFRHQELFQALRALVLPQLIERNQHCRRLRVWSAGCANGAEAYSLAILLRREFAQAVEGWEISILGTDINREFLARALEGRFSEWTLRGVAEEVKQSCFTKSGDSWVIAPQYREWVSFQYHNLVRHPFPSLLNNLSAFDLILCRNVMIYFNQETIARLAGQFHQCLTEGGWLGVGHAEPTTLLFHVFSPVSAPGVTLFQKDHAQVSKIAPLFQVALPVPAFFPPEPKKAVPRALPLTPSSAPDKSALPAPELPSLEEIRGWADQGAYEKAVEGCRKRLEREPLEPAVHFYLALVLEQVGAWGEAEQSLRRAIYLDRDFVLAHYHLGLFWQKRGKSREAVRSFQNVLALLEKAGPEQCFAEADGLSAPALQEMARMHLEVLEKT
jgi:chemotaxis protein methyltransferase CheR